MKKFWKTFAGIFGLNKNSKYVKNYLNEANMRSGIFMSAIIVVLEIWLVIRQADKYMISIFQGGSVGFQYGPFQVLFTYTSNFWLLMSFGAAMFFYCLFYQRGHRAFAILTWIFAGISLALCGLMPLEFVFF